MDYTAAQVAKENALTAIGKGVSVVIGTSGLTDEDFIEIDRAAVARRVGVGVAVGNFAVAAILLQRFACVAARHLTHWEIIDYASDRKVDAPSGTASELGYLLSQV